MNQRECSPPLKKCGWLSCVVPFTRPWPPDRKAVCVGGSVVSSLGMKKSTVYCRGSVGYKFRGLKVAGRSCNEWCGEPDLPRAVPETAPFGSTLSISYAQE